MNVIPFPKEAQCCCNKTGNPVPVLHVPAAQRSNARGRFAATEKAIQAMMPVEAFNWVDKTLGKLNVDAVYITGPGDPLAVPGPTMETLQLLKGKFPQLDLGITTLGLGGQSSADMLAQNGVNAVTLLVDAVDADIIKSLYTWIRPGKKTIPLAKAAEILLDEQMKAILAFKESGFAVDIRTTVYPGINDEHVEDIARKMASLEADSMTLLPCREIDAENGPQAPDDLFMVTLTEIVSQYIAVNTIDPEGENENAAQGVDSVCSTPLTPKPTAERSNVAVVSSNGMDVDLHLGQAFKILIYGPRADGLACLLETRLAPESGGGGSRWEKLADSLGDCFALLTSSAGGNPRKILSNRGISVIITEDNIEGMVDVLYGGGKKSTCKK
ncbi:MAG: dinitrogenase iron-molybdenum cofactor biosynthesis protein [Desulfobulbaceae bacterium]|uniref:Dinitrogenase iron-molybdenum cofactor biosynthesis protein n=1 Tax=Candidatus Desulfobia pelagia TaxID=2841692 RepID=A0A8J6NC26_9BACT|nr:dinitrogenase iron-molybdenum cofactor biosynthesis protein [Candidatus Desulfobia pelagia]